LAQLAHPNVVAVHDVGTFEAPSQPGVFIVMELVDGEDLASWGRTPRPWRQVVAVLCAAGRGLAAAHARDLVHRDFKPANVLIDAEGRVRVADFGLAQQRAAASEAPPESPRLSLLDVELTDRGLVCGTPAYMAPELADGRDADPRSDQFAYCAAFWELLHGARPHEGRDHAALHRAKLRGELAPPVRRAPGWLDRLLRRGLSPRPEDRFPSLQALLDRIERELAWRRRRRWWVAGLLSLAGLVAWIATSGHAPAIDACDFGREPLVGVWDDDPREAVRLGILATGAPYAATSWETFRDGIDDYTARWLAQRREACETGLVDAARSMSTMSEQMLCLDRALTRVAGLTALYRNADTQGLEQVAYAVADLPPPEECVAPEPPAAPSRGPAPSRDAVLDVEGRIAEVAALFYAGRLDRAHAAAVAAVELARESADELLLADAELHLGRVERGRGHGREASEALFGALEHAERAGADRLAVEALIELVFVTGRQLARPADALALGRLAEARIDRRGLHPRLRAALALAMGRTLETAGRYEDALEALESARRLAELDRGPRDPMVADAIHAMGVVLERRGDIRQALAHARRAVDLRRSIHGDHHPAVSWSRANVGSALLVLGQATAARPELTAAVADLEATVGDHPGLAFHLASLARAHAELGDAARARALQSRAITMVEGLLGHRHPWTGYQLAMTAQLEVVLGDDAQALEHARQARAIFEAFEDDPLRGEADVALARASLALGHHAEAVDIARGALTSTRTDPLRAALLEILAEALIALDRRDEAEATLVRLVDLRSRIDGTPAALERARADLDALRHAPPIAP
jgi:tetratricopeptide (TPR) repeat protein